jgi:hypothetical protein
VFQQRAPLSHVERTPCPCQRRNFKPFAVGLGRRQLALPAPALVLLIPLPDLPGRGIETTHPPPFSHGGGNYSAALTGIKPTVPSFIAILNHGPPMPVTCTHLRR